MADLFVRRNKEPTVCSESGGRRVPRRLSHGLATGVAGYGPLLGLAQWLKANSAAMGEWAEGAAPGMAVGPGGPARPHLAQCVCGGYETVVLMTSGGPWPEQCFP